MRKREQIEGWRSRGYLPHYEGETAVQFITYRLADSLPRSIIERMKIELGRGAITEIEYYRRFDKYLDEGRGESHLKKPAVAEMVEENLLQFDGEKYELHSWVVMPNHVHLLLAPLEGVSLARIMHSMKSYTSHQANKILNRTGHFWSKEYFDRYIRNAEHYERTIAYI